MQAPRLPDQMQQLTGFGDHRQGRLIHTSCALSACLPDLMWLGTDLAALVTQPSAPRVEGTFEAWHPRPAEEQGCVPPASGTHDRLHDDQLVRVL